MHASLLVAITVPLVAAAALLPGRLRPLAIAVAPWTPLPACLLAVLTAGPVVVDLPWLVVGTWLGLDDTGRVLLPVSGALWVVCGLHAVSTPGRVRARARFMAFFLVSMAGNLGLLLAADAVTFYVWFSVMSFASCGLVMHDRRGEVSRAGRVYVAFVAFGEALLFVGIVGLAWLEGDARFPLLSATTGASGEAAAFLGFVLAGFGVKLGAVPVHMWAPLAYRAAPIPAAAALSGPMLLAGLLGWLRFLPLGTHVVPGLGAACLCVGFVSAFWGVIAGLGQREPRAVLGYSSVSQMGLITAAIGAALLAPAAWPAMQGAIWLFAVHHALAKTALVLGVGVASAAHGAAGARIARAGLLLPSLALAGVPFTSGAAAKTGLKHVFEAVPGAATAEALLPAASVGTALLMVRFLALAWPRRSSRTTGGVPVPWILLVAAVGVWCWLPLWHGLRDAAVESAAAPQLWSAFWPAALAAVAAWCGIQVPVLRRTLARIRVPAGDIIVPLMDGARAAALHSRTVATALAVPFAAGRRLSRTRIAPALSVHVRDVEAMLQRPDVTGTLAAVLMLALLGLLAGGAG